MKMISFIAMIFSGLLCACDLGFAAYYRIVHADYGQAGYWLAWAIINGWIVSLWLKIFLDAK